MAVTRWNKGDKITLTQANIETMKSSNRSSANPGYPSADFIAKAEKFVGCHGEVTHTFEPSYEITVFFNGEGDDIGYFHMKDHWISKSE